MDYNSPKVSISDSTLLATLKVTVRTKSRKKSDQFSNSRNAKTFLVAGAKLSTVGVIFVQS